MGLPNGAAGLYRLSTSAARSATSFSSSGGSQRRRFTSESPAWISGSAIPRRRIVPARLRSVACLVPLEIRSSTDPALLPLFDGFEFETIRTSHSGGFRGSRFSPPTRTDDRRRVATPRACERWKEDLITLLTLPLGAWGFRSLEELGPYDSLAYFNAAFSALFIAFRQVERDEPATYPNSPLPRVRRLLSGEAPDADEKTIRRFEEVQRQLEEARSAPVQYMPVQSSPEDQKKEN